VPSKKNVCNGSNSAIKVNGISQGLSFAYSDLLTPTVTSLSVTSASPILKTDLIIQGSLFGNLKDTQVFLYDSNGTVKYELTIREIYNSSSMKVILGGGRTGNYSVRILKKS
jgi:hypothetical protein